MKKTLLIILAIVLILVGGIWVYLMFFGAPESSDEFFADLGFGTNEAPPAFDITPEPTNDVTPPVQEIAIDDNQALNLLTVRPTAGAVIVGTSTDFQHVRYVEKGSGIIHEINLQTNDDTILDPSGTENTYRATWSQDGTFVVIQTKFGNLTNNHLLTWVTTASTSGFESTELPPDASQFGFSDDATTLYYVRSDNEGTLAYKYNVRTQSAAVWFSVPFIAANFEWGDTPLIYNRPGEGFTGFAYRYINNGLVSIGQGGDTLVAKAINDTTEIISFKNNGVLVSYLPNSVFTPFSFGAIPEKCAHYTSESLLVCGFPETVNSDLPISWYKGEVQLNDSLWVLTHDNEQVSKVADLFTLSGQALDVIYPSFDDTGSKLIFTDKSTGALWLYDVTK